MPKEINRVSFEIEHYNGDTYMGFMLAIMDDGSVGIINVSNCSLADVDEDYIFKTNNTMYRIQADEPISEDEFEEIWDCYNEHRQEKSDNETCELGGDIAHDCADCAYSCDYHWLDGHCVLRD